MTLLIWNAMPQSVTVLTDTLATTNDYEPCYFANKVAVVPHLPVIVAGTGSHNFLAEWQHVVQTLGHMGDIDRLAVEGAPIMRHIWDSLGGEEKVGCSATVYQFGPSPSRRAMWTYRHRSDGGFEPEDRPWSFAVKPGPDNDVDVPITLDEWIALAVMIRDENNARTEPREGAVRRVVIGGDLVMTSLDTRGVISSQVVYRFDNYADDAEEMAKLRLMQRYGSGDLSSVA